jgi:hypothetical protein
MVLIQDSNIIANNYDYDVPSMVNLPIIEAPIKTP